jgi:hypothetical protein
MYSNISTKPVYAQTACKQRPGVETVFRCCLSTDHDINNEYLDKEKKTPKGMPTLAMILGLVHSDTKGSLELVAVDSPYA